MPPIATMFREFHVTVQSNVIDRPGIEHLLAERKPGHSLPQPFYVSEEIFALEMQAIFHRSWTMVGFEVELDRPGAYIAMTVGGSPILVLRDRSDRIVGFFNSCRHRGSKLCRDGNGRVPRIVCPYHQWTYDLDGRLLAAPRMAPDFDRGEHGLIPIRVETVAGCIYAALSDDVPDFETFRKTLEPALLPHNLRDGKVAHIEVMDDVANWKLVMENGRECNHCEACHPELKNVFALADFAEGEGFADDSESGFLAQMRAVGLDQPSMESDWWQVGRIPFIDGCVSYSMDGTPLVAKRLNDRNDGNVGSLRWAIEPANFCHASGDCAVMVNVEPVSALKTRVTTKFLVHKDAVEGVDYDVDRLTYIWNQTNLQDRALAENNQAGVNGAGYRPGPYAPESERFVVAFIEWYLKRMAEFAGEMTH